MFFLQFEATPRPSHPDADDVAGAIVNCWIDAPTLPEAESRARRMIEAAGWIVGEPDEADRVNRADYDDNPAGLEYFEQALLDKEVFVFHTYPVDSDGGEENH